MKMSFCCVVLRPTPVVAALLLAALTNFASAEDVLFENVRIFDGTNPELSAPSHVLVEGNVIKTISDEIIDGETTGVTIIDGEGKVLMPGLIDAHWHTMLIRNTPDQAIQ